MLQITDLGDGKAEWNLNEAHIIIPIVNGEKEMEGKNTITINSMSGADQALSVGHTLLIGLNQNLFEQEKSQDLILIQNPDVRWRSDGQSSSQTDKPTYALSFVDEMKNEIIWTSSLVGNKKLKIEELSNEIGKSDMDSIIPEAKLDMGWKSQHCELPVEGLSTENILVARPELNYNSLNIEQMYVDEQVNRELSIEDQIPKSVISNVRKDSEPKPQMVSILKPVKKGLIEDKTTTLMPETSLPLKKKAKMKKTDSETGDKVDDSLPIETEKSVMSKKKKAVKSVKLKNSAGQTEKKNGLAKIPVPEINNFRSIFDVIQHLSENNLIKTTDAEILLQGINEIKGNLLVELKSKSEMDLEPQESDYSTALKAFAFVTNFQSTLAFQHLCRVFGKGWPSSAVIREWRKKYNAKKMKEYNQRLDSAPEYE